MAWLSVVIRGLRLRKRDAGLERELREELEFHLTLGAEARVAAGMKPEEARVGALDSFGEVEKYKAQCRAIRRESLAYRRAQAARSLTWLMIGCGLAARLVAEADGVHHVGDVMIAIAVLWRLLLQARGHCPPTRDQIGLSLQTEDKAGAAEPPQVREPILRLDTWYDRDRR